MKNHIITIFLLVLVVTLCASTIFFAFGIVSLRKSNAEIIKEADSDKLSLNEEMTKLKESFHQNRNPTSQIIDGKNC